MRGRDFVTVFIVFWFNCVEISTIEHKINYGYSLNFSNFTSKYIFLEEDSFVLTNLTGVSKLRIVNGQTATRGQFCYQAYLQFSDGSSYWSCGGSLVTTSKVLTAAHCVKGASSATVVLGAQDLNQYEPGRVVTSVSSSGMKIHEKYDENSVYNDIALITLTKTVKLTKYICTAKLPSCVATNLTSSGSNEYMVSGWGKTTDRTLTYRLMYVNVTGEERSSCAAYYRKNANYQLTTSQMCSSGAAGKSTCNGDSGGPLVQADQSGSLTQHGIVSLGMSSCELSAPSVYTNVNYFITWLCPLLNQ